MKDLKREKLERDWLERNTLTPEQRKKLIEDKVMRATAQSNRLDERFLKECE